MSKFDPDNIPKCKYMLIFYKPYKFLLMTQRTIDWFIKLARVSHIKAQTSHLGNLNGYCMCKYYIKHRHDTGGENPDELPLRRTLGEPQLHRPSSFSAEPKPPPEC